MPDVDRIEQIEHYQGIFSAIGATEDGGLTRLLYTDEWLEGQNRLKEEMEKIGMTAEFDSIGNLFGTIEGSDPDPEVVATGSHIDTVVNGGRLDGQFGIVAGLIAIKNLTEEYGQPKNSLQLISIAEEEGSRFPTVFWGSKNIFGIADNEDGKVVSTDGKTLEEEMRRCGFDYNTEGGHGPDKFMEIHVEQGRVLEDLEKEVGIVTAITGQKRYDVKIVGEANHAGSTLMQYRKDPAYAYAKIVASSIEKCKTIDDIMVVTFGRVELSPGTVNVIPGQADFTIDTRHPDKETLDGFAEWMEDNMKKIAEETGCTIEINKWMEEEPTPMDEEMVAVIKESADELGLDYHMMHSGAGHDSQIFAANLPTAMMFAPSIGGISHNPNEETRIEDLAAGVKLIERSLYKLAY